VTDSETAELMVAHRVGQDIAWETGNVQRAVYHYTTERRKAFIHPIRTPNGLVLTALEPSDHPWHRGVWFAWKYLNGVNFWEETAEGSEDGRTVYTGVDEVITRDRRTRVTTSYDYLTPGGDVLLRERRVVDITLEADGTSVIDWDSTFTAVAKSICLDRTIISPETPWGGYAGFSFRATKEWRGVQGLDSEGRRDLAIKNQRARWVQMTGVGEDGCPASIAMLDHPQNPRYPSYWYYSDDSDPLGFAYLNPSLVLAEPYDLASGDVLRLRYRLLLIEEPLDGTSLNQRQATFAEE
jgi:hypothetical protein